MGIENENTQEHFILSPRIHQISPVIRMIEDKLYKAIIQVYGDKGYSNSFHITSFKYDEDNKSFRVDFKIPFFFENTFVWYFDESALLEEMNNDNETEN